MKNKKLLIALGAVCLVNFIAHLCFYPAMPDTVPMHWGFNGQVDGWGPKYMILVTALIPAVILLLIAATAANCNANGACQGDTRHLHLFRNYVHPWEKCD